MDAQLRQRRGRDVDEDSVSTPEMFSLKEELDASILASQHSLEKSFFLTRVVFLRSLAAIYGVSFAIALAQNRALIGTEGLMPFDLYLSRQGAGGANPAQLFARHPTLLWFLPWNDTSLDMLAYAGLFLSAIVALLGAANTFVMVMLWLLSFSIIEVGGRFYQFGWESQLLETGFLAIFVAPLTAPLTFSRFEGKVPIVVPMLYRWLLFRIMLGAGLIKIRGDSCWRDLTCMYFHYETQPVPGPLSLYFHYSPEWFHRAEVAANHFVELFAPFLLFAGRDARVLSGCIQLAFQFVLILSGNLSFLNWLTMVPALWCLDDGTLRWLFSAPQINAVKRTSASSEPVAWGCLRSLVSIVLVSIIGYLSIPVVQNMASSRQVMNTSFNSLRIVNTYGAFGSITKERTEVVFEGTRALDPENPATEWREYSFPAKPGNVTQRPPWITPYHYRLDWLLWFAAFGRYEQHPYLVHFAVKLLAGDRSASTLLLFDPFAVDEGGPPRFIRARHYNYKYADPGATYWWERTDRGGLWLPPISLQNPSVRQFIEANGWEWPSL